MTETLQNVDHSSLRTNQAMIILLLMLGFIFNVPLLAALVSLVMLGGTYVGKPGFEIVYRAFLKPRGIVKPDVLRDNPEPHRFAQGMGGSVLVLSILAFIAGSPAVGWTLVWLVIALAALNLFGGFCAGCAVYYWLNRLRVPGFVKTPPTGTIPGMRPKIR